MSDVDERARDYDDIPGTLVFDARRSRAGYRLNTFLLSLNREENRAHFLSNEEGYLKEYGVTDAQRDAVIARDYTALLALGGQVFYVGKLAHVAGLTTKQFCARQAGMTEEAYSAMLQAGGRAPTAPFSVPTKERVDG